MRRTMTTGAVLTAALLTAVAANPAQAASSVAPTYVGCSTTGSSGGITINNWYGPDATVKLAINVYDTASDGHHARVRLVSKNTFGTTRYWPWRMNYDGPSGKTWNTTASDSSGLFDLGVQVATFEGDTLLHSCTDW